jgi:hypothetical protein
MIKAAQETMPYLIPLCGIELVNRRCVCILQIGDMPVNDTDIDDSKMQNNNIERFGRGRHVPVAFEGHLSAMMSIQHQQSDNKLHLRTQVCLTLSETLGLSFFAAAPLKSVHNTPPSRTSHFCKGLDILIEEMEQTLRLCHFGLRSGLPWPLEVYGEPGCVS